jgi:hypothetical protein
MTRLTWADRFFEVGVDHGVFYPPNGPGEAWNGLVSVQEIPPNADNKVRFLDGIKSERSAKEEFAGVIQAYTYPESFHSILLTRRRHHTFGMSYRTKTAAGYKIHLVYNVLITPTNVVYLQDEGDPFNWGFTTKPVLVPGVKPSAHIVIDTAKTYAWTLAELENIIYGSEEGNARLPLPDEVFDIFERNSILKVIDNGDGTFTVDGPESAIQMLDATTFQITWPSAVYIDEETYTISSL